MDAVHLHIAVGFPVLVVALLAGCAASPSDPAGGTALAADVVPTSQAPVFAAPAAIAVLPNTGHESFLAVSPDGRTILTCAHGDFREPVHKFASTDGGATFAKLDAGPVDLPAGDCEVALGPQGAWSFSGKTEAGIAVHTTTDGGATWIYAPLAGPPLNGAADRQWMAYVGESLLVSYQPGSQAAGTVLLVRSTDLGRTWSSPVELAGLDPAMPFVTVGDFLVGPGPGDVRVPLVRSSSPLVGGGRSDLAMLRSADGGQSWTAQPVAAVADDPWPSGAAVTPSGGLVWAYSDRGEQPRLLARVSLDGTTWSEPVELARGLAWDRPWASARPDGLVDVAWLSDGSSTDGTVGLAVTRIDPGSAAGPVVHGTAVVAAVDFIEFAAIAHDGAGRAHVAVIDAPSLIQQQEVSVEQRGTLLLASEALPAPTA